MISMRIGKIAQGLLLGSAAVALASGASAQTAQDAVDGAETEEAAIVVTGTRIKGNGYDQPTPVTVATAERLLAAAPMTLSDGLVQLPQFTGSTSRTFCCAPGSLGNFLNLRGLGPLRTLILLDGRRIVATRESGEVDVNLLPELLVQRVDVVTGGASAVYGSDAVSGVVNYVTDSKFEGVRANAQYGISDFGDDASVKLGVAAGTSFSGGRGHIVASIEHFRVNGIRSLADRPDSRRGGFLGGNGTAAAPFTSLEGVFLNVGSDGGVIINAMGLPIANAGAPLAGLRFLPGGATTPFVFGTPIAGSPAFTIGGDGHQNNLAQPAGLLETQKLFARLTYDFTDNLTGYIRLNAAQSHNNLRILADNRSAGLAYTIFRDNAFLPAAVGAALDASGATSFRLGRFNRDFGAIVLDNRNQTFDVNVGLEGKLSDNVRWSASYSHGETTLDTEVRNVANNGNSYAAADAVRDPASGAIVCRVTLTNPGVFPGCAPLNPFGVGAPSAAARAFILGTSTQSVKNKQDVFAAELQGDLFELPGGSLSFATGAEYRTRSLVARSNAIALGQIQANGVRGVPGVLCPTLALCRFGGWNQGNFGEANASDNVKEAFVEILAPLFRDSPLGHSFEINAAYRYTDYQNSGTVGSWKLGATYEPFDDLRLRVTRSRDIRAPNLFELFAGPVNAFTPGLTDPVTGLTNVIAITRTQGNRNLQPERANTFTAGFVYSPGWLPGLSGSVDYYDINLTGALAATTAQGTIDGCQRGIMEQCALITRDPATRAIQQIILQQINLNSRRVRGVDFDISYNRDVGAGRLSVRALASRAIDFIDTIGTTRLQAAGLFQAASLNTALPKWRGTLSASYEVGNFNLFVQERYIGSYDQAPFIPGQIFAEPRIRAIFYTDVTARVKVKTGSSTFEIFGTVNNIFSQRPPFLPNRFAANLAFPTVPNLYDLNNRYFTIGARVAF